MPTKKEEFRFDLTDEHVDYYYSVKSINNISKKVDVFRYGISPNKLFDYLAAQRPIVFACSARNNPVAEAGAGITVPPQNPKAMAEAVYRLATLSPEVRAEMGKRGRTYVESHHSYQRLGEQLNYLLEEVREAFKAAQQ